MIPDWLKRTNNQTIKFLSLHVHTCVTLHVYTYCTYIPVDMQINEYCTRRATTYIYVNQLYSTVYDSIENACHTLNLIRIQLFEFGADDFRIREEPPRS